jgi:hypothetical protein
LNTKSLFYIPLMLMMPLIVHAGPVWSSGTPADGYGVPLATTTPTPLLGGVLLNFDSLTAFTSYSTYTSQGVSISSPDGLVVYPYSSQSDPNELFDNSAAGSANISVETTTGNYAFGVGIADSDPVTITLQALGAGDVPYGPADVVTIPETGDNPGNGYYYVEDASADDIYGFTITQSLSNANYSGLAIDDVQASAAPEPSTWLLLIGGGFAMIGSARLRKKA